MALSKNNHMSKAVEQMGFAGDFDAGLATEEKQRAAHEFDGLVRSALSGFAGSTVNFDHSGGVNGVGSYLTLSVPQEDGSSIGIVVSSATLDDGSNERRINVQAVRDNATGDVSHSYYIENGQVLRHDVNAVVDRREEPRGALGVDEKALSAEEIKYAIGAARNEMENGRLEQQMGLNCQPVGVDEINKLAELLVSAQPVKQ
jgi:hypothetical protein